MIDIERLQRAMAGYLASTTPCSGTSKGLPLPESAMVPSGVFRLAGVTGGDPLSVLVAAIFIGDTGPIEPAHLVCLLRCPRSKVFRSLGVLMEAGVLKEVKGWDPKSGKFHRTTYTLPGSEKVSLSQRLVRKLESFSSNAALLPEDFGLGQRWQAVNSDGTPVVEDGDITPCYRFGDSPDGSE